MSFGMTKHQRPNHARSSERRHHAYGHKRHRNQKEKETGPTRIGVLHHRSGAFLRLPLRLMGRHREDPARCLVLPRPSSTLEREVVRPRHLDLCGFGSSVSRRCIVSVWLVQVETT